MQNNKKIKKPLPTESGDKTTFLITEFQELGEFWRHTDSRIEAALNFYLTTIAFLVPAAILLYQAITDTKLMIIGAITGSAFFLYMGAFLIRRVNSAQQVKSEYKHGLNLIRRYFVDKYPDITNYLYLPISYPLKDGELRILKSYATPVDKLLLVIYGVNSLFIGIIVGLLYLLVKPLSIGIAFTISVAIFLLHLFITMRLVKRKERE